MADLLIVCPHCHTAVRAGDLSAETMECPYCAEDLRAPPEARTTRYVPDAPSFLGTTVTADGPTIYEEESEAPEPESEAELAPESNPAAESEPETAPDSGPSSESVTVTPGPTTDAIQVLQSEPRTELLPTYPDRWTRLDQGAKLVRVGLFVEWVVVTVFVVVVAGVILMLAPSANAPAGQWGIVAQQEFRVLGPSLLLLPAVGLTAGAALVAVGRLLQASAVWSSQTGRVFWATAGAELLHGAGVLACAGNALLVYFARETGPTGRETYSAWLGLALAVSGASRLLADVATVMNFTLATGELRSESLLQRAATVGFWLQILGLAVVVFLTFASLLGALPVWSRLIEIPAPGRLVLPGIALYVAFTVYTVLATSLQLAVRRAVAEQSPAT